MKSTSLILPLATLILAGTWIGMHRQSISELKRKNDDLAAALSSKTYLPASEPSPAKPRSAAEMGRGMGKIDWNIVAIQLERTGINDLDQVIFNQRLGSMSKEELLEALDEIALLTVPLKTRESLEEMVIPPLCNRFPDFAVMNVAWEDRSMSLVTEGSLAKAMESWALVDYERASRWLDLQTSSGVFSAKALNGHSRVQTLLERALVLTLLQKGGDGAALRLAELHLEQRKDVLMEVSAMWKAPVAEADEGFLKLVRTQLPAAEQTKAFVERAQQLSRDLPAVSAYLDQIEATPEERLACVQKVALWKIANIAINRSVNSHDIVAMREWLRKETPEAVDRFTGESLGYAAAQLGLVLTNFRKMSYSEAAAFAVEFNEAGGNDQVLEAFLKSEGARTDKARSRVLAENISSIPLRTEILKTLE